MRGQAGFEYLIIIGFLMLMTTILAGYYNQASVDSSASVLSKGSLDNFKAAADHVYSMGPPAKQTVTVAVPDNVDSNRTGISGSSVEISYLDSNGNVVDVFRTFSYNISGSFPNQSGTYHVTISSLGSLGVGVSYS